jgi:glucuronyl/N-acetylglucosaminyl transferase EXT2
MSPLVQQMQRMRKARSFKRPSQIVFWCYVFSFVGLCSIYVAFLRNQHALQKFDASIGAASLVKQDQRQEYQQRKLEDISHQDQLEQSTRRFSMDPIDYSQYTVRINSWKRPEQLQVAIQHYQTCSGVAQIQIVWCTAQGDLPEWLVNLQSSSSNTSISVVVERHEINSLNERFHVLEEPATRGILTVDDDVLRPCLALDAGFYKWTQHPDHMVGYDARSIDGVGGSNKWKYGYLSTTKKTNQYALTLTRFAFLHVDYLKSYMTDMPQSIRDKVHANLNCEDIAMSLWVSNQTNAQVPLLADYWAMNSLVKLHSNGAISAMGGHKKVRDECVDEFASILGLKDKLQPVQWVHDSEPLFDCGVNVQDTVAMAYVSPRLEDLTTLVSKWKPLKRNDVSREMKRLVEGMIGPALNAGLVQGTDQWKKRFQQAPVKKN